MDTSPTSLESEGQTLAKGDTLPSWNLDLLVAAI